MIELIIEEYCQNCLDFTPDVIKPERAITMDGEFTLTSTIIKCKYCKRCSGIKRYLEQQMKAEAKESE